MLVWYKQRNGPYIQLLNGLSSFEVFGAHLVARKGDEGIVEGTSQENEKGDGEGEGYEEEKSNNSGDQGQEIDL